MLTSCDTINKNQINLNKPIAIDSQFDCGIQPKLPSDEELKTWTPSTIFSWGEAVNKWGISCHDKLIYNKHFIACIKGNKQECVYVNSIKDKI